MADGVPRWVTDELDRRIAAAITAYESLGGVEVLMSREEYIVLFLAGLPPITWSASGTVEARR